jgi:hypothetical protein
VVTVIVSVERSGGFAGLMARGELDTSTVDDGERVEDVVSRLVREPRGSGVPQPDRYVYRVRAGSDPEAAQVTLAEQDLDDDAKWLIERVLARE